MFVTESEMKALQLIEKRNKLLIKQIDDEGNEVERKTNSDRGGRGRSRFGRGGSSRSGGSRSRFGDRGGRFGDRESRFERSDRNEGRFSRGEGRFGDKPARTRERGSKSRFPRSEGKRDFTDSSFGAKSERYPRGGRSDSRGKSGKFERPSTKDLMKDFLPNTKPER